MKYLVITLFICFFGTHSYAQGSWNIAYVEIDALNASHLNAKVKLDFKHEWLVFKKPEKRSIRHFIVPEDTASLMINNVQTTLLERRSIYTDHGSFNDQFLEIENGNKKISQRIYDTELLQIEENRVKVQVVIQHYKMRGKTVKEELESEAVELWLDKSILDGVMIEK